MRNQLHSVWNWRGGLKNLKLTEMCFPQQASPFFCKLLQSDMKENREGIVRFEEISSAVMEDVLEFIYTGSVEVNQENSKDLIAAANYLLVPGLKKLSARFLEREMSKSNCISTFYFAEMYQCDELITNTRKFIHANFASVTDRDEFLNLEAKEVERWISSDEISVAVEADVFKIVLKWIEQKSERRASFEQLFGHVRLASLPRDFLLDVVTNVGCLKLISDAAKLTSSPCEGDVLQSPRKGLETRAVVACGGKYTLCYLPEKDEWKRLADGLLERNYSTKLLSYLQNSVGQYPKPGQSSVYQHLFQTTFDAHDALEDVIALRRILFSSKLTLSDEMLVNRSSVISVKDAAEDLKYLDNRHQRLLSFRGKLYNPGHAGSPIKQGIAEKIAGSGLAYEDLKDLYQRFGRKGLVCILTRPPLSTRSTLPRVTNTPRIVSAILKHFEEISKDSAT